MGDRVALGRAHDDGSARWQEARYDGIWKRAMTHGCDSDGGGGSRAWLYSNTALCLVPAPAAVYPRAITDAS